MFAGEGGSRSPVIPSKDRPSSTDMQAAAALPPPDARHYATASNSIGLMEVVSLSNALNLNKAHGIRSTAYILLIFGRYDF